MDNHVLFEMSICGCMQQRLNSYAQPYSWIVFAILPFHGVGTSRMLEAKTGGESIVACSSTPLAPGKGIGFPFGFFPNHHFHLFVFGSLYANCHFCFVHRPTAVMIRGAWKVVSRNLYFGLAFHEAVPSLIELRNCKRPCLRSDNELRAIATKATPCCDRGNKGAAFEHSGRGGGLSGSSRGVGNQAVRRVPLVPP